METDNIKMIKEDLNIHKDLAEVSNSNGGKIIVSTIIKDIIAVINTLGEKHSTLTQQEFIALGAKVKVRSDLLGVLLLAEGNREYYEKLLEEELRKSQ